MKKYIIGTLLSLFPLLALANNSGSGSLSLAPPASDLSVVFLSNLFGVVDGVLHGTGSQIMGSMFGVFNSAVLALGGIIIMYTLIVSTMNTAHEGQMLGQKWSSIWIPVRSTAGLALLIPKASGYCMMQIFVMWLVVQGVGAADKVWDAALSYLNRGGVIIQAQSNPTIDMMEAGKSNTSVFTGGMNILAGQVCMLGIQKQLDSQRQGYLNAKQKGSGPCYSPSGDMKTFCDTAVPDFIGTVNAVMYQNQAKGAQSFTMPMPNFDKSSPYFFLNGICGSINWNPMTALSSIKNPGVGTNTQYGGASLSSTELQTAQMTRAIAIQQMYLDLSSLAQIIVNNDPQITATNNVGNENNKPFSLVANQQFGVPYTRAGEVCTSFDKTCVIWGPTGGSSTGVLFNGTEFQGAVADYNGIMMPTLKLIEQNKNQQSASKAREFIKNASSQGWMTAGSYFFDLINLQGSATKSASIFDTNTGLESSQFDTTTMLKPFGESGCKGDYAKLCIWLGQNNNKIKQVAALIDGSQLSTGSDGTPVSTNPVPKPNLTRNSERPAVGSLASSTVYGFINNSVMVQLPGQPGVKKLTFAQSINFSVDPTMVYLQEQSFPCGNVKIVVFSFCLGQLLGNIFYNLMFRYIYNFFLTLFQQIINQVVMAFLMIPLNGMADIFKTGVKTIQEPGVNPIIALANMGAQYINFSGNLWIMMLNMSVTTMMIPIFGPVILPIIMLAMPLLIAWIGIMVAIGFITAYYIPILPYMIFTFGVIAWLMAVIEAMVAAPIVALGVTHPEGHDAFGKGEAALMILMNVFLRPAMMVIGYISGIALSYVGVWILNSGFDHAIGFIQQDQSNGCESSVWGLCAKNYITSDYNAAEFVAPNLTNALPAKGSGTGDYTEWAGIYAFFFSILSYTTIYMIIVQRAFTLISYLPDKILRWIGGAPEGIGEQAAQWGEEVKQSGKEAQQKTYDAQGAMDKQLQGYGAKAMEAVSGGAGQVTGGSGGVSAKGTKGAMKAAKNMKGSDAEALEGAE